MKKNKNKEGIMTLKDIRKLPIFQTTSIAYACMDLETNSYVMDCLRRFFIGDYGEISANDKKYNNQDLRNGEGHILAYYRAKYALENDFYIEAHFSASVPWLDANNTMIMYCNER